MKTKAIKFFATVFLLVSTIVYGKEKETISIISLDTKGLEIDNETMASMMRLELEKINQFEVLDKYDVNDILTTNNIDPATCFGKNAVVKAGKLLAADWMLTGNVELFGDKGLSFGVYQKFNVTADTVDTYQLGFEDGILYHKKQAIHFMAGFLIIPTGAYATAGVISAVPAGLSVVIPALSKPIPSKGKFTFDKSRNSRYFDDPEYLEGYKRGAKRMQRNSAAWGTLTFIGVSALLFALTW